MRLISLYLKNIRSYKESTIEFPEGITLLAGDIGAGKSTILLGIEFALFGISRSELTGTALLRHGAQEGIVRLQFSANDKEYTITRALRRTSSSISQDTGSLLSDGSQETLTPSELRAKIFAILGYPAQFLSKQKNLLYRFTIYTPQEDMKSVLSLAADERIETVRRLFGIDAYRAARENAHLVAKAIKERETKFDATISRIKIEQERVREQLAKEHLLIEQLAVHTKDKVQATEQQKQLQTAFEQAEITKSTIAQERQVIAMKERERKMIEQELVQLADNIRRKNKMLQDAKQLAEQLRSTIKILKEEQKEEYDETLLLAAQQQLEQARQDEGKILSIIDQTKQHTSLLPGSFCPTCKQQVSESHVQELRQTLFAQEQAAQKKRERNVKIIQELRERIQQLQGIRDRTRQKIDLQERLVHQDKRIIEDEEQLKSLQEIALRRELHMKTLQQTPEHINIEQRARTIDQAALEAKYKLTQANNNLLETEKKIARIEQEITMLRQVKEHSIQLTTELATQQKLLTDDGTKREWLLKQFTPFATTVERHLLYAIHHHFDSAFRNWFTKLLEDESIGARIDHEFCPVITQAGFETETSNLSGGERTSVSLAWRLALVHTIHALVPNLGTAGLIILDEPTDGFSAEQLERVRDVLQELVMEQIIIVSHEQQLEGFVDHILRVRKTTSGSIVEQSV